MVLFLSAVIIAAALLWKRTNKQEARAALARTYWSDMGRKYYELVDDPSMGPRKWREWLPLFEDADRQYAKTHPYEKDFFRYAELVREEIDDLPYREVGPL